MIQISAALQVQFMFPLGCTFPGTLKQEPVAVVLKIIVIIISMCQKVVRFWFDFFLLGIIPKHGYEYGANFCNLSESKPVPGSVPSSASSWYQAVCYIISFHIELFRQKSKPLVLI